MPKDDVKSRMREARASVADLARFLGIDYYAARRIANGERKSLSVEESESLNRFFDTFGRRDKPVYDTAPLEERGRGSAQAGLRAEIPLFGGADTRDGWRLTVNPSSQVGRVLAHPRQISATRAYAVEVIDRTMEPRFRPGEIAYVAVGATPSPGQDCVVEYEDMTAQLLQFVERTDRQAVFLQLNPQNQIILRASDKFTVHAVVGRG